jgi:hypothetical protein
MLGLEIIGVIPTALDVFVYAQQTSRAFSEILKKISPVEGWLRRAKSLPL